MNNVMKDSRPAPVPLQNIFSWNCLNRLAKKLARLNLAAFIYTAALLALIPAAPACDGQKPQELLSGAEQVREVNKWNTYVDLNNDLTVHFFLPLDHYFTAFGRSPEYRPASEHHDLVTFVSALPSSESLQAHIDKTLAATEEPENELDESAREMALHLNDLLTSLSQSRDYHAAQSYTEDDFSLAADLHARIYEAQTDFQPSYHKFSQLLHERDAQRRKTDIESMLSQGLSIKPAMLQTVDAAQNMQDYFNAHSITSETILNLDPDLFMALFEDYVVAVDDFLALTIEPDALTKEGLREDSLEKFNSELKQVLAGGAILREYSKDTQKGSPSAHSKSGDLENLCQDIGILVDTYNYAIN
ncbi:hypothetical protein C4J81_08320 [Deltaproteobacteria bacterium Smac51]|nr:hypothetical protein C4J81_08320 [Deltaproteobacteria bacterium Smac51]